MQMYNFKWAVVILFQALAYTMAFFVIVSARDLQMQSPLEYIFVCFFKARFSIEPMTYTFASNLPFQQFSLKGL